MLAQLGNEKANSILEENTQGQSKPQPKSP